MKKQMSSWHGDEAGASRQPTDVSCLGGCISKAYGRDLNAVDEDDLSQLSHQALSQDPRDSKARSTGLETRWIKKNLQTGRMSEGLLGSQRGLTDCSDPKEGTLKAEVSRSPSQRLLLASKPLPPIQTRVPSSEPRRTRSREQKWRPGADSDDSDGRKKEPISVPKADKASQQSWYCSGGNEKMSLGMPVIPPIPKSARPLDGAPHSTAESLPSSQRLFFQKALETRLKSDSRGEERILKPLAPLPAIAPDSVECAEKSERGDDQEDKPSSDAQQALLDTLTLLSSDDWKEKTKGLFSVRHLAICHPEVLLRRLHDVSLAVTKEGNNLHLKVSLLALNTLEELFRIMKKRMDPFVDKIIPILLQSLRNCNMSVQKAASQCLRIMVGSVTPARAMTALLATGIQHRNVLVRKCAAEHLLTAMEQIGAQKLLSGKCYSVEALVRALVKLAQDCHQDTRCYGQKMMSMLMSHQKFEKYLKQCVSLHDLRDVTAKIRQKGIEELGREAASAKKSKVSIKSGQKVLQNNLPSDAGFTSGSGAPNLPCQRVHHLPVQAVEETEEFMKLYRLLTAEDFQSRLEGVQLLRDHCKSSPWFITSVSVQVFGVFVLRIQDCNEKVKQQALEALAWLTSTLRDVLHPVLVSLVEAVTENQNSKHPEIYAAAVEALEAFIVRLGLHTRVPILPVLQHHAGGGMKPDRELRAPVAPLRLPPVQTKEMDHVVSPNLQSGDNSKDSNGRIDVTLSTSVQKMNQQQRRVKELVCREREKEREKSSQLLAKDIDPGAAAKETTPLPATAPDSVECAEKAEHGDDQQARPFPDAHQALLDTLTLLSSDDWKEKTKGLFSVRRLAICHPEVLLRRLPHVSWAVTKEVKNLRWKVCLPAIRALEELFRIMKKHMDPFVDAAAQELLQRMGNCSMRLQKAANQCLGIMVGSVTPARAMTALLATGIQHRNVLVRKCAAEHLLTAMEQIGAQKLLSGKCYSVEALVRALVKLAQDCHQDTRCYGQKMLSMLMSHEKFEKYLKQCVPSHDLRDVTAKIRQKNVEHRRP